MNPWHEPIHDADAERAVLGGMLLSRDAITDVIEVVGGHDFYRPGHELIFGSIMAVHGRGEPADAVTVAAELTRRGELSRVGGAVYLHTLMSSVPTAASAGYYAVIVRDRSVRRNVRSEAQRLYQALDPTTTAPEDLADVVALRLDALSALMSAGRRTPDRTPHLAAIPEYPVDAVPGPLGDLVRAGIQRGLDPALVGGAGLGAISAICGNARVEVRSGQKPESASLWVPLGGDPGAGKSPAMHLAFNPVYDLERKQFEQFERELEGWESAPRKERGPRPVATCLINDDATLEAVARWLRATGGHGGLVVDELTGWIGSIGRYRSGGTDGGERARHLSLWDGAPWKFERVTQGINIRINNPALAVCGGIQPDNYALLGPESDGMRPRWLPHLARVGVSAWNGAGDTSEWDTAIKSLYAATHERQWLMSAQALKALDSATARWRQRAHDASSNPSVTAAARKADRQAVRVALALAESIDPGAVKGAREIGVGEMEAAIAVVEFSLGCWNAMQSRTVLALSQREERLGGGVDQLATWLEAHGGRADRRTLQASRVAGARTAATLNALLAEYEATYPGSICRERVNRTGPETIMVYAPRRGATLTDPADTGTVAVNSSGRTRTTRTRKGGAGQSAATATQETVDTVNSSSGNSSASTVPGPVANGSATGNSSATQLTSAAAQASDTWPAKETGPCVRCGDLHHRYGDGGTAICPECRKTASAVAERAPG